MFEDPGVGKEVRLRNKDGKIAWPGPLVTAADSAPLTQIGSCPSVVTRD